MEKIHISPFDDNTINERLDKSATEEFKYVRLLMNYLGKELDGMELYIKKYQSEVDDQIRSDFFNAVSSLKLASMHLQTLQAALQTQSATQRKLPLKVIPPYDADSNKILGFANKLEDYFKRSLTEINGMIKKTSLELKENILQEFESFERMMFNGLVGIRSAGERIKQLNVNLK